MKVVYFGTPPFAADVLSYLLDHSVNIVAVITKPDKPRGRSGMPLPTPVKQVALFRNLPLYQPELVSTPEFAPVLASYDADLFVVVAYGEIIKQHLLDMPKMGCINVHPSLLPKYRGAAPIQRSIINGDIETGVTIMHMTKKMDAGDMIRVAKVPISLDTTYGELERILCVVGSEALLQVIHDFEEGHVQRTPQNHDLSTLAKKIELEDCQLDWRQLAINLHNLVRGVNPEPGAWCCVKVRGKPLRLKVFKTYPEAITGTPGAVLSYGKGGLLIACGEGSLRILEVQLEGKKAMSAEELLRGIPRPQFQLETEQS